MAKKTLQPTLVSTPEPEPESVLDTKPVVAVREVFPAGTNLDDPNLHVCPTCGVATSYRCPICGATRSTNAVNQAIIWMRNGRVIGAFHSALQAWSVTAARFAIPADSIPPQFRSALTTFVEE